LKKGTKISGGQGVQVSFSPGKSSISEFAAAMAAHKMKSVKIAAEKKVKS